MKKLLLWLPDEASTRRLGQALGACAVAGDLLAAVGDLGAGKTCLAQGVAQGLEVPSGYYVNSPTFNILKSYPGRLEFHHIDLYRLSDPDEALGLGLDEVLNSGGLSFLEWPGRIPELIPLDHLHVVFQEKGEGRLLRIESFGPDSERWLIALSQALEKAQIQNVHS